MYIISIILIILCFIYRDSKKLFVAMFFWMWILFAFSNGNSDYAMYSEEYIQYGQGALQFTTNFFFILTCKVCYVWGMKYNMFLAIYSMIRLNINRKHYL